MLALVSLPVEADAGSQERVLYTFGDHGLLPDSLWFRAERDGGVQSFDANSAVPVDGTYGVWGGADAESQIAPWAQANGVRVDALREPTSWLMTAQALATGNAYVPLLALGLAAVVLLLVQAARENAANTQKLLNGVRTRRIVGENVARGVFDVLAPAVAVAVASIIWVALTHDARFIAPYAEGIVHVLGAFIVGLVVCIVALTVFAGKDI